MWPSGQPMAPDGSWPATMLLPVAMMSAAVSTPGTTGTGCAARARFSRTGMRTLGAPRRTVLAARGTVLAARGTVLAARGTVGAGRRGDGFAGVEHQALADERVQRPFRQPGGDRALHDVPDQQPVVGARQRMIVVAHPHSAFEPPVWRVQAMRVVVAAHREPRPPELGLEFGPGVDADVAAGDVVVVIRQPPADPFRQPGGHGHRQQPARAQYPRELTQVCLLVVHVLVRHRRDDM